MAGFDQMALTMTGKIGGLQFKNHEISNGHNTIVSKILENDFDYSIIVGTDPISHLPQSLSSRLAKKPIVLIDNQMTATAEFADLILPMAITGVECEGLAVRLDQVPVSLDKIVDPPNRLPSDEEILHKILDKTREGGS